MSQYVAYALIGLLSAAFCCFYLLHDHDFLSRWFVQLQPCFYRSGNWAAHFFTPAVKQTGNMLCVAGLLGSFGLGFTFFRKINTVHEGRFLWSPFGKKDIVSLLVLLAAGIVLWCYANAHIEPYNDEVFSAVYCADDHPFHALAYYMLPNNHIFYNLLNNLVFRGARDHVFTGRLISGAALLALLILLYGWFRWQTNNRFFAVIAAMAVAIQFQVWGFSAMARGYELYLLCEWGAVLFLGKYFTGGDKSWLRFYAVATVIGFATLPTFLYLHLALILVACIIQLYERTWRAEYFKYLLGVTIAVFLFYLPALCFSGIGAFTENDFVKSAPLTHRQFFPLLLDHVNEALQYCFTGYLGIEEEAYLLLAAVPVALFCWRRRRERVYYGLVFLTMWSTFFAFTWYQLQFPFLRNLTGHLSITYGFIILTIYYGLQDLAQLMKRKILLAAAFPLMLALFYYHYLKMGKERLARTLYHFRLNTIADARKTQLQKIPSGAAVSFSDESFYLFYLARKQGRNVISCAADAPEILVKTKDELLPAPLNKPYRRVDSFDEFEVYRKQSH